MPKKSQPDVFLAEDDTNIADIVKSLFRNQGYDIVSANDGKKAMMYIQASRPPKIALLDIMMPFYDGFQLVEEMKNHPNWKDIPILMLTANSRKQEVDRALELGVTGYIVKPFKPIELMEKVSKYLR